MPLLTVAEIARLTGGQVSGDPAVQIRGVAPLDSAGPEDLSFVANPRYATYVQSTRAAAILVPESLKGVGKAGLTCIRVRDPHESLAQLLPVLYPEEQEPPGVHPTAVVDPAAIVGRGVAIGPYAVIGRGARIGDDSRIGAHTSVGAGSTIGTGCILYPHVTLYRGVQVGDRCILHSGVRLGADGFGYVFADGEHRKVPQVGGCRIGDDVEIGANTTIDRGSVGDTTVGSGTKIDNLVHIGHNARIGSKVLIAAQAGIAGSSTVGDFAVLGGQAGVSGHLSVGARARIGAQAGIIGDVAPGETVSGYPARPHREALRAQAALFRLPRYLRRIEALERAVSGRAEANPSQERETGG